jgi:hypothetical protein
MHTQVTNFWICVESEVPIAVTMKSIIRVVRSSPCCYVGVGYSSVLKMGAVLSSETSMNLYRTTWRFIRLPLTTLSWELNRLLLGRTLLVVECRTMKPV